MRRNVFSDIRDDINILFGAILQPNNKGANNSASASKDWEEHIEMSDKIKRKIWKNKLTGRTTTVDPHKAVALVNKLVAASNVDNSFEDSPAKSLITVAHKITSFDSSAKISDPGVKTADVLKAMLLEEGCDVTFLIRRPQKNKKSAKNNKGTTGNGGGRRSSTSSLLVKRPSPLETPTVSSTMKSVYK